MEPPKKYPARFDEATHALVLKTRRGDAWLFEGVCPIVRRPACGVAIQGGTGATVTFSPVEKNKRETGTILNISLRGFVPEEFKVVPFNPDGKKKGEI